ncbi:MULTISPECIES: phosphate ABC transporter ATP-binding protein PstB [Caloramator]|uniref:Phosphate transport ATP-binding protein PstB (TC 3.A.1.7.1) n=1 Tax=Caloramator australicus RC3 TaxID=857293 RepID=G0V3Z1_9CLOT|nr:MULTISPECIES: phosphate ABC transporter ATP-binding protein PstB [Caloramator]MDO6354647.1 phosphate ABC transporter ATP-binding protein PstB [Caloramator sp. CAR-1]CCC57831.1 Phosphate transport ATP-binding protein PstB (TC 3.A.1.7.1) [Caloramator australicus RC3]
MESVIKVENLNFYYGNFLALKDINMDIYKNNITAFIGPSGCGKSTFLRTLNRMNDFIENTRVEGKILFQGQDIYSGDLDPVELRRRIGMVFQKPNPFPKTIYENIVYGLRKNGVNKKEVLDEVVESTLKAVALYDEVKDKIYKSALELSGGQQQRLCIARAIAMQPEVVLMDEPTSALDPISTLKIEELLLELKKNYTIIIVTHSMQQAARISDWTAFFLNGEVIEYDTTEKIFENPRDKRTEDYITGRFG